MLIEVKRVALKEHYTIGKLYIDGVYVCDTLEDKVRIPFIKVYGSTAIPAGTYKMVLDYSNRFKKIMPHILNVPEFEGIRIHSGNTDEDTYRCILVGYNKEKGKVIDSRVAYDLFRKELYESKLNEWEIRVS